MVAVTNTLPVILGDRRQFQFSRAIEFFNVRSKNVSVGVCRSESQPVGGVGVQLAYLAAGQIAVLLQSVRLADAQHNCRRSVPNVRAIGFDGKSGPVGQLAPVHSIDFDRLWGAYQVKSRAGKVVAG